MEGSVGKIWLLLVTVGILGGALAAAIPEALAADRDAPNFTVAVTFTDPQGGHANSSFVSNPVNITANVTIAPAQPGVTDLQFRLRIDGNELGIDQGLGALQSGNYVELAWQWIPMEYGDHAVEVTAFNGTDHSNQTVATCYFRVLSSNVTISSLVACASRALIGVETVNISATLQNAGNLDGMANVSFALDGTMSLGYVGGHIVPAGGTAVAVLATNFSGPAISDGNHTVTASLSDLLETSMTTSNITLANPTPDIRIAGLRADPSSILVGRGETVDVTITAKLANNGTAADRDFPVSYYDGLIRLGEVAVNASVAPGSSMDVSFAWSVTDSVLPGEHSLAAGVGDEDMLKGHSLGAVLFIDGSANVSIDGLAVTPAADMEGANVTFTARLLNNGTKGASGLSLELYDGDVLVASEGNITMEKGQILDEQLCWTLPDVDRDTVKVIRATVGDTSRTVNVTVKNRAPRIEILSLDVPAGLYIDDTVNITATVKNGGNGDAEGMTVDFFDSGNRIATSDPFDLSVGSSRDVTVTFRISGAGDQNHTFSAESMGAQDNVTRAVGHRPAPALVVFKGISVSPKSRDGQPKGSEQSYTLTVVLRNTGELRSSNCTLRIMDGKRTIAAENIVLAGGNDWTKSYTWKVSGSGDHKAVAVLAGADAGTTAPQQAQCSLGYTPGFEVLVLFVAVIVAFAVARGRAR